MRRSKLKKSKSKAMFKKGASRTQSVNNMTTIQRGGWRF